MDKELEIFKNFINNYDLDIEQLKEKVFHTYRVVNYAQEIAKSLSLNEEDINKAGICGLFHDLGRFPQYTEYQTFHDNKSFDHGDKSYDILKDMGYNDEIVLNAVKYHNKYSVPNELSDREKLFANITRDADKIDILLEQLDEEYTEDYKIPETVMKYFNDHEMLPNNLDDSITLSRLRCVAFIFDVNYTKSYEIIDKSGVIDFALDNIYKAIKDDQVLIIKDIMKKTFEEKINN